MTGRVVPGATGAVMSLLLDTSMITSDLVAVVQGKRAPWVPVLAPQDAIRCFITHRVWAEVPRVLHQWRAKPDSAAFDLPAAERLWWEDYLPALRVVTVQDIAPFTEQARMLAARDRTDIATAVLADLLGSVVVMADDKDLRSYASTPWRQMRPAAESVVEGDMVRQGSTVTVVLSGYAAVGAGRAVMDLAARRPLLLIGAAAATALALYWQRDRLTGLARTVKELAPDIVDTAVQHLESERAARVSLREAAHVAPAQDLLAAVASTLACAPGPLTRTELAHRLRDAHAAQTGHRRLMAQLRDLLHDTSIFHEPTPGHWELGRRDVGALLYRAATSAL